ncbi:15788_t:CDS:2 [Acaulospora colombiana]|uniref:15788_t:CDS:1 n=1 Tax=Acaulospora colombiana TaxID=27376 RepID=A0ACA9N8Z7_9GLOM|nr:15788_t:CDS:2 [Acaulospora colombiana]
MSTALQASTPPGPLRLLVFDAGPPVGALMQLLILENILMQVDETKGTNCLYAHEHFDLIAGTGLGGQVPSTKLIAILLGGLRKPISEVKEKVKAICEAVFSESGSDSRDQGGLLSKLLGPMPPSLATEKETLFSVEKLRRALRDVLHLRDNPNDPELHMDNTHGSKHDQCLANMGDSTHLRTYKTRSENIECTMLEALTATIASSDLFSSEVTFASGSSYVGAGLGINNPIREILMEAKQIYGESRQVGCLLSIGTVDIPPSYDTLALEDDKKMLAVLDAISDCRRTASAMNEKLSDAVIYHRFSVQGPLTCARVIDWNRVDCLSLVHHYLQGEATEKIEACAHNVDIDHSRAMGVTVRQPPPLLPYFVVREEPMKILIQRLLPSAKSERRLVVITGEKGSGKSQLSSYFCDQFSQSSEATIQIDLQNAVRSLGYSHRHATWEDALAVLAKGLPSKDEPRKDWLLVFDDARVNVAPFIPSCQHGSILVNSQSRVRASLVAKENHVQLGQLSENAAQAVFFKVIQEPKPSESDIQTAEELFRVIGRLPLHVVAAGLYWYRMSPSRDENPHLSESEEFIELFKSGTVDMELLTKSLPFQRDGYDED